MAKMGQGRGAQEISGDSTVRSRLWAEIPPIIRVFAAYKLETVYRV